MNEQTQNGSDFQIVSSKLLVRFGYRSLSQAMEFPIINPVRKSQIGKSLFEMLHSHFYLPFAYDERERSHQNT